MKKGNTIKLAVILLLFFSSCKLIDNNGDPNNLAVSVGWELISNTSTETPQAKTIFSITNEGQEIINDKNWAMFFNQNPRNILSITDSSKGIVERLKGDWYRVKLKKGKTIKPGETITINYISENWYIKETDGPMGLYTIWYDSLGNELQTKMVDNFIIKPFVSKDQINRHRNDNTPIPTPEWQFDQNKYLDNYPADSTKSFIPTPQSISVSNKITTLSNSFNIVAEEKLNKEAKYLSKYLEKLTGTEFSIADTHNNSTNSIILHINNNELNPEAYTLDITDKLISISGGDNAGVFYGIQSLLNSIDKVYYKSPSEEINIQQLTVKDKPRFPYRGLHIDVCRNFQTKDEILRILDLMAFYKLNKFHFYITEDEGWRIEIEELPELTSYGSKRGHTFDELEHLMPAYGSGPDYNSASSNGSGYYTRADFKEIITYANERHISVIPSINFPGHARAAVKSMEARYRHYIAKGDSINAYKYRLIDPNDKSEYYSVQYYNDNVVDVGLESTYAFYEIVVDDIIEMYAEANVPLEMIHTGGDEVPNGVWTNSPASIKLLNSIDDITDPKNLQSYFFKRIFEYINKKGIATGGWEEIVLKRTENGEHVVNPEFVGKDVYPYAWNNLGNSADLTNRMANAGYPVIFCGVTNLYFDMAYNKDPKEPGYYWGGFVNERKVWELSPFDLFTAASIDNMGNAVELESKVKLLPEARKNIIGLQSELWGETIKGSEMLEYYLLPKLISFAEKAWAQEPGWESMSDIELKTNQMNDEWSVLINTISQKELPRLTYLNNGYNYRIPVPGAKLIQGLLHVNHEYPGTNFYYTTDGSEPNINSSIYSTPIEFSGSIKLKAINSEGKESRIVEFD